MQTIAKHCPKICCLNLTFASFETEYAFKLFVKHLCPKIKHLAMDNLFIKPCLLPNCQVPCSNGRHNTYRRIFSSAVKLVDLEVRFFISISGYSCTIFSNLFFHYLPRLHSFLMDILWLRNFRILDQKICH